MLLACLGLVCHLSSCCKQATTGCKALAPQVNSTVSRHSNASSVIMKVAVLKSYASMGTARIVRPCLIPGCSPNVVPTSRTGMRLTHAAHAQECVQNCECPPQDFDGLWVRKLSVKVPPRQLQYPAVHMPRRAVPVTQCTR